MEEEEKLTRLEKRLVANIDLDDPALQVFGFHMDIYYLLGHLGWARFSNRVSANTHKEFALEVLMIMAPILDKGVTVSHFVWKEMNMWFPMSTLGSFLAFKREPRSK
jgi:hypothetical protein